MRRIRKHALAESDLIGIWQYTFERWDAICYTVTPSAIHIIRVLHGQMDPGRHL